MTYDEFMSVINSDVERILEENSVNVAKSLFQNLSDDEAYISESQLQIIRNAVNTSIQFSVQIVFDYLSSLGMLDYENLSEHYQRPVIEVVHKTSTEAEK